MMAPKKQVLFVCLGNICRSPTGEAVFHKLVADRGMEAEIHVDSAGTIEHHAGEEPDPRMRVAAGRRGYALRGRARKITRKDLEQFDLIVAMDRDNYAEILKLDPYERYAGKIRLLCDFIPDCPVQDVPDPYYGGARGFDQVIDMIESAGEGILEFLAADEAEQREIGT